MRTLPPRRRGVPGRTAARGKDRPGTGRAVAETDPHLNASTFRSRVLQPAFRAAGVEGTIHSLRHAHASWLLAGGADLQVVKERLGHAKISDDGRRTFTRCPMPTEPRSRHSARSAAARRNERLDAARREIDELKSALVGLTLKLSQSA